MCQHKQPHVIICAEAACAPNPEKASEGTTMRTRVHRSRCYVAIQMPLLATVLLLASCVWIPFKSQSAIDLEPFQQLASAGQCADIRNQLFLIDDQLVFWDQAGSCADASYSQTLFGSTPDQILCIAHDSIAGPMTSCQDERYQDLFDTITANLDKPDLGLGSEHTVQQMPF
jgi:hypothetical protein